jgi:hypothetical protein
VHNPGVGGTGFPADQAGAPSSTVSFRPGTLLSFRVVSDSSGDSSYLEGHGIRVNPPPSVLADTSPGDAVRLRVVAVSPRLILEALAEVPAGRAGGVGGESPGASLSTLSGDSFSRGWSIPPPGSEEAGRTLLDRLDVSRLPFSSTLVSVILNSQRILAPRLIGALSRRMERWMSTPSKGPGGPFSIRRRARALLEIADRGMEEGAGSDDFEELLALLSGLSDGSGVSRDNRGGEGRRRGSRDEGFRVVDLAAYLTRGTREPEDPLQLFNHLSSTGDLHWIIVPVAAVSGGSRTAGSLRVGIDRVGGFPRSATLELSCAPGTWWFSWKIVAGLPTLETAQAVDGAPEMPATLLARLGGTRHTVTQGFPSGDGFSAVATKVAGLGGNEHG